MNIIQLPLGEVHPYKNNPRKNDGAVDAVAESIRQYGFLVPLVISADHEIITGHTRFKAAKKLGLSSVPCVIADELTEEQIRKVMNVISDDGALTILKIRTYDKSFEDAVAVSAVPEVTAKFQEDIETYQLHDYFIRGKNRAGAGSDYIYRKMMYEWFGEPYVVKYLMEY